MSPISRMLVWLISLAAMLVGAGAVLPGTQPAPIGEGQGTTYMLPIQATTYNPCAIQLPEGYDPSQSYPLVIGLHGFGSAPGRFVTNWFAFESPQFIYACPEGPYPAPTASYMGFSWLILGSGIPELEQASDDRAVEYVLEVLAQLKQAHSCSGVYLLGFSQGAALAYRTGIEHPELFSGIACIAGRLEGPWLSDDKLSAARQLPVFIAAGTEDEVVKLPECEAARDTLQAHGLPVEWYTYPGGHDFDDQVLKQFQQWMQALVAP